MATTLIETCDGKGHVISSQTVQVPDEITNADTLRTRSDAALTANDTYLALVTPTQAQKDAQLVRVTKECSALIRLLLGRLDTTQGT